MQRATKKSLRAAVRDRRSEIEQRLADFGLERGPHRLSRTDINPKADQPQQRLRCALEMLGPTFSAFGLYLSSRVDLWQARDCLELAGIPDKGCETPEHAVRSLLAHELGRPLKEIFTGFEAEPFESRLLFQAHHARLHNGNDVIVKIIHPEFEDSAAIDVDLLPLLKHSLGVAFPGDEAFESVLADFRHTLSQRLDFDHQARAFEAIARDAEDYEVIRTPFVYRTLCTSKVLVIEKLDGLRLNRILPSNGESYSESDVLIRGAGFARDELARLLCEVWITQALRGHCFPVEPRAENILLLPGKQIVFTEGVFAGLPTEPQANLWDYLIATANENSDRACDCLLGEMRRDTSFQKDEVRQRFRQAMPFRDGGWSDISDHQSLAEILFVHWRFAGECGYLPLMHLPPFYRGLFNVSDTSRRLAPKIDPLKEGLRDARLIAGLCGFRELMGQRQFGNQIDKYAAILADLPQTLDGALTLAAQSHERRYISGADGFDHRRGNSSAPFTALLLVLAAVVILSQYITAALISGPWANRFNAMIFLLCGALLLRAVSQVR
jgi:predicted unusual protein kinase regulating ubiquinone biosynthesis (AarF/ABC1/UbiB family)